VVVIILFFTRARYPILSFSRDYLPFIQMYKRNLNNRGFPALSFRPFLFFTPLAFDGSASLLFI